ncbi:hypothetical protein ACFL7M_11840 [Thermodesulfobacteriota bacterium]
MQDSNTILERYHEADFHIRLNLYLLYPQLRRTFLAIDSADKTGIRTRRDDKKTWFLNKFLLFPCASIFARIGRRWGF